MNLTPEQRATGKENFQAAIGSEHTRRDFLKGTIAAGVVSGAGLGAMYFGYGKTVGGPGGNDPVRVGVIGTGDEGSVLIGAHNPNYTRVVAIADIRPYNIYRAFHGDWSSPNAIRVRSGLLSKYDYKSEAEGRKNIKVYDKDYRDLLNDKDVEAVIIALPLHLHAQVAIQAMRAGKHVLTEKLMGHSVGECKEMARVSRETGRLLATGHQRHYSILYDNALDVIQQNLIGNVHSIRAQWHRLKDTWSPPLPGDKKLAENLAELEDSLKVAQGQESELLTSTLEKLGKATKPEDREKVLASLRKNLQLIKGKEAETLLKRIAQLKQQISDQSLEPKNYGYEDKTLDTGHNRTAMEELIRWRLWQRTGGGLMAELGSHQLDASSLFISAVHPLDKKTGKRVKVQPLAVSAVGGKFLYDKEPRECEDHVYCTFEFPGPEYFKPGTHEIANGNKKIVVTYSSINGNGWGDYGETVMGDKGTLLLQKEEEVMLFKDSDTSTKVGVVKDDKKGPTLDTTASGSAAAAVGKAATESGPISRGYTEEIEHWAWCIRNFDEKEFKADPDHYVNLPRCHPKVAMGDAIIALVSNMAIRQGQEKGNPRVEFKPEWFDIDSDETPEGVAPNIQQDRFKFA